jgi:hypothetical protein
MAKITDPDDLNVGTEITFNLSGKTFTLVATGNLDDKEGVTGNALWAKFVDLWTSATYQPYPFPMNIIDARSGQYIFGQDPQGAYNGWKPADDTTRQMIRDAGWSEYSSGGVLNRQYVGMVALASGFPVGAQFFYQKDSTESAIDFTFDDAPNEAIQVYGDASNGNFDDRTYFKLFCREESYLYDDAVLGDVGETGTGAYKVQLPIAVGVDLDIQDDDTFIATSVSVSAATWSGGTATIDCSAVHGLTSGDKVSISGVSPDGYNVVGEVTVTDTDSFEIDISSDPGTYSTGGTVKSFYDRIKVRYFTGAFNRDIESATGRDFGIVIDAGTHSGIDGSAPGAGSVLTTSAGGLTVDYWIGGTLVIYEGTDEGTEFPITDNDATTVTVTGTIASGSGLSFTLFPPAKRDPVADLQEIYTKVQYLLRQDLNINSASGTVNGKTAALLLNFVGTSLKCGFYTPTNPNGGGTGVLIQGVLDADMNSVVFYDNTETSREYPYASVGAITSNAVLTAGGTGYYRMYFTTLPGAGNDYGESGAVTVNDADGDPITGTISSASISFTFDYTNNSQGGRTPGTDAAVTLVAGNPGSAKPFVATGLITASKSIVIALAAETDRGYIA